MEYKTKTCATREIRICLSGPLAIVEQVCREYCLAVGLCVTVTPTRFIYTGGEETGATIGLAQYPRFPDSDIDTDAAALAERLLEATAQLSLMVVTPEQSIWLYRAEKNA